MIKLEACGIPLVADVTGMTTGIDLGDWISHLRVKTCSCSRDGIDIEVITRIRIPDSLAVASAQPLVQASLTSRFRYPREDGRIRVEEHNTSTSAQSQA